MRTNLKEKRVHRGGSTISQQLAKNLWLSRDRTLLRKMQEALLTVTLEAAVPKDRILEIYLNGIEWGPGIYGVKRASRHYFAKDPSALTPKEAAYLATIIPSPRKYYGYFRKGAVSEKWEAKVMYLLGKLRDGGFLTAEEYEEAEWTPLRFASSGDDPWTETVESATVAPVEEEEPE
jgi:membrane peptidoglycan carboxypeptidase